MSREPRTAGERPAGVADHTPPILVLTGARQSGKTVACRRLVEVARARGFDVAGIVSPAVFTDGHKVGIDVLDVRTGQGLPLAVKLDARSAGRLGYRFDSDALAWAGHVLASVATCDLLIVDEIGPLEMQSGQGLVAAFDLIRRQDYRLAVIVVRPELVSAFLARLDRPARVVDVAEFQAESVLEALEEGDRNG